MAKKLDNLRPHEAAEYLRTSVRTLARWRNMRVGPPFIRSRKAVLYRRTDLDDWLAANTVQPVADPAYREGK